MRKSAAAAAELLDFRLHELRPFRTGYDPHLQEYHVRNRAYDPRQGRWLQTDPLGFDAGDFNLH